MNHAVCFTRKKETMFQWKFPVSLQGQRRVCSEEQTSGSAQQTQWHRAEVFLSLTRRTEIYSINRILILIKAHWHPRRIKQCRASMRELSGQFEKSPKHGTEAKPTVVSCDVPCTVCAAWNKGRSRKCGRRSQRHCFAKIDDPFLMLHCDTWG